MLSAGFASSDKLGDKDKATKVFLVVYESLRPDLSGTSENQYCLFHSTFQGQLLRNMMGKGS